MTKKKPSIEGKKMLHLKGNDKNANECNFSKAFAIAHAMKHYNQFNREDQRKRLSDFQLQERSEEIWEKDQKGYSQRNDLAAQIFST